eukprot:Gb_06292 [translate_table: standard]
MDVFLNGFTTIYLVLLSLISFVLIVLLYGPLYRGRDERRVHKTFITILPVVDCCKAEVNSIEPLQYWHIRSCVLAYFISTTPLHFDQGCSQLQGESSIVGCGYCDLWFYLPSDDIGSFNFGSLILKNCFSRFESNLFKACCFLGSFGRLT